MLLFAMDTACLIYRGNTLRSDLTSCNQGGKSKALYVILYKHQCYIQIFKETSEIKEGDYSQHHVHERDSKVLYDFQKCMLSHHKL